MSRSNTIFLLAGLLLPVELAIAATSNEPSTRRIEAHGNSSDHVVVREDFDELAAKVLAQQAMQPTSTMEKTAAERITDKALIGAALGGILGLSFGVYRLTTTLRTLKRTRGFVLSYRARLVVAGSAMWIVLIETVHLGIEPDWLEYSDTRFLTILFSPPLLAALAVLLWDWTKKAGGKRPI